MKLATTIATALTLLACACGDQEAARPVAAAVAPPGDAPTADAAPPPPPPLRTLIKKPAMTTSTENLVTDPEFQSLWTAIDETGFGIYEAYATDADAQVQFSAVTPAGVGAAAATITPQNGQAALTMIVVGGKGPLSASVWIAASAAEPPHVQLASLFDNSMVSLTPDPASTRTIGEVKYVAARRVGARRRTRRSGDADRPPRRARSRSAARIAPDDEPSAHRRASRAAEDRAPRGADRALITVARGVRCRPHGVRDGVWSAPRNSTALRGVARVLSNLPAYVRRSRLRASQRLPPLLRRGGVCRTRWTRG